MIRFRGWSKAGAAISVYTAQQSVALRYLVDATQPIAAADSSLSDATAPNRSLRPPTLCR